LAPADHPLLDAGVIDRIIAAWRTSPDKIWIPVYQDKRGHPTIFPWRLAAEVFRLPRDLGLNNLLKLRASEIQQIEMDTPVVLADLDTPEDYARLLAADDRECKD
jgi:molybdenum cofactor cytidylyltransferase